jgi:hypothetical protein
VLVDLFAELATNNLEKPAMPFRMSRELKFWVEGDCDHQRGSCSDSGTAATPADGVFGSDRGIIL